MPLLGKTTPRIWTKPLVAGRSGPCGCGCALTRSTSKGFSAVDFAEAVLGMELIPWQRWLLIHALELRPDGRFRFRTVLILVARQNGKTSLVEVKNLWKMFVEGVSLVISVAQELDVAEESWDNAVQIVEGIPELNAEKTVVKEQNGKKTLVLSNGSRWKPKAAGRRPGRGLSGDDVNLDELREHQTYAAWAAVTKTTMARPNPQVWAFSNAGDDKSIVLNEVRGKAIAAMEGSDEVDEIINESFGIFEWSAAGDIRCTCIEKHPDRPHDRECKLRDRSAWAQANPSLGFTITEEAIASALATDPEEVFRTEVLCQRVESLEQGAIPIALWTSLHDAKSKRSGDIALGVDLAVMHDYGAINVYGKRTDDLGHGQLIDYRAGTAWIVARLADAKKELNPIGIGMGRGTYEALKKALNEAGMYAPHDLPEKVLKERGDDKPRRGDILVCTGINMAAACSQIINATRQRTYRVVPAQALDDAIAGGHVKTNGDSMAWARKDSRADICPIGGLTVARFCYETWSYLFANTDDSKPEPFFAWA